jgi:homoserine kinase
VTPGALVSLGSPANIEALVCVAPMALATEAARKALPAEVSFGEAAANAGRAALLAATLARGETAALLAATEDSLHQPARFALMPDAGRLVRALRADGIAAFLAGAGPSVAALVPVSSTAPAEARARRLAPDGWEVRRVEIASRGAEVVETA